MRFTANEAYLIPLRDRRGRIVGHAIVDRADADAVLQRRWHVSHGYPRTSIGNGHRKLHQLLIQAPAGMVVDHINGDKLDNRRSNLRVVTQAANQQNRRGATVKSKSGVRGVYFCSRTGKWAAGVQINRKTHFLGRFSSVEEAAAAATAFRAMHMPYSPEATA